MKAHKKLTFPLILTLFFAGLLLAGFIYALIRYSVLASAAGGEGVLETVLWEVIPALIVLVILYGAAMVVYFVRIRSSIQKAAKAIEGAVTEHKETDLGGEWAPVDAAVKKFNASAEADIRTRENKIAYDAQRRTEAGIARDMVKALSATSLPCVELDFSGAGGAERSPVIAADLFDGFYLGRRTLCFMTADIWGTGFAAARFASRVKELFRDAAHSADTLGEAVLRLNQELIANNPDELALTGFFAVFMPATGELRYVNAGSNPPVLVGKERAFLRVQPGCPLGLYEEPNLTEEYLMFKPGRCLVTYTNGAVEARDAQGQAFGYDRLFAAVKDGWDRALGADRIVTSVLEAVKGFAGGKLGDDCAVYALYYPNGIQTELMPKTSELERLRDTILDWLKDDPRKNKIFLACEEIFTNIVNHSGATSIHLNCQVEGNSFVVRFTDDGEPFNPLQVRPEGGYYPNNYAEGGMSMAIIRQIAGEIFYRTQENRNVLTIRFPVIKVN